MGKYPRRTRDTLGRPIPDRLLPIFAGAQRLDEWCRLAEILQIKLGVLAQEEFGCHLHPASLNELFEKLKQHGLAAIPYALCDCHPQELDCPKCEGRRWLTQNEYLEAYTPRQ